MTIAGCLKRWISCTYVFLPTRTTDRIDKVSRPCVYQNKIYALHFGRVGALRITGSRSDGWNGHMKSTIPVILMGNVIILWRFGVKANVRKLIGHHNNNSECPNMINTLSLTINYTIRMNSNCSWTKLIRFLLKYIKCNNKKYII